MRKKDIVFLALSIIIVMTGVKIAQAEITLTDWLSVTGYLRYELAVHTGAVNPNNTIQTQVPVNPNNPRLQTHNNDFNFSRTYFQTEWTAKFCEDFKLFAKIRLMGDQTESMDDALVNYKAFPVDVPKYDWMMMKGSTDKFRAEASELYSDLSFGNLWLRLGKQQIVWGEMISTRILDVINPLDMSRNFLFEPEEFENIRIPEWAVRGRYQFGKVGPIAELMFEGFVNPGDVQPTQYADFGSPFNLGTDRRNYPPFNLPSFMQFPPLKIHDVNRRGDIEYGLRVGGMIKSFYLTLNYLRLYNDEYMMQLKGARQYFPHPGPPDYVLYDLRYPLTNVFGVTGNYFINPLNTVVTFETTWIPDQPYQDGTVPAPNQNSAIKNKGTWNYAVRFDRQTFVFPPPINAMMIQLQFNQTVREGDPHDILGTAFSKVNKTDQTIICQLDQYFFHNTLEVTLLNVYQFANGKDGEYFKPQVRYFLGNHWIFDLYTVYTGGSDKREGGHFGGTDWVNETVGRITYQF